MSFMQIRQESSTRGFQQSRMIPDSVYWPTRKTIQKSASVSTSVVHPVAATPSEVRKQTPKPKPIGQAATMQAKRQRKAEKNRRHRLNKAWAKLQEEEEEEEAKLEADKTKAVKWQDASSFPSDAKVLSITIPKEALLSDAKSYDKVDLAIECSGTGNCFNVPPFEMCMTCSEADFKKRLALRHTRSRDGGCFQDQPQFGYCDFCVDKLERGVECYGDCLQKGDRKPCHICVKRECDIEQALGKIPS